jgi:hypothetical protein
VAVSRPPAGQDGNLEEIHESPQKSGFYEQVVLCQGLFAFVFFLNSVFAFAVVGFGCCCLSTVFLFAL